MHRSNRKTFQTDQMRRHFYAEISRNIGFTCRLTTQYAQFAVILEELQFQYCK